MATNSNQRAVTNGDSVSDWIEYVYTEKGQKFVVTHLKSQTFTTPLAEEGPFHVLSRNGRYLHPYNEIHSANNTFIVRPEMYAKQRQQLRFRDSDIVICAYPRCGCTWMEQLVLLLLSNGDPSTLNTAKKNVYIPSKPERNGKIFVETMFGSNDLAAPWGTLVGQDAETTAKDVDTMHHRRVFKTHYPAHLLPGLGEHPDRLSKRLPPPIEAVPGVKYIIRTRDPKDVCVSLHRVNALPMDKHGMPFTAYSRLFVNGLIYEPWNNYMADYLELSKKHPDQFIIVPYEDNRSDPQIWARRVANFLDLDISDDDLSSAVKYSSFNSMKDMSKGAKAEHVHKGKVGGWRELMNEDMVQLYNDMVMDERLGEYGHRYFVPEFGLSDTSNTQ